MTPPRDAELIAEGDDVEVNYDHAAERYELIHYAHGGLEAVLGFVAVHDPEGRNCFNLLRRREVGRYAQGYQVEGTPTEAFGEAVGDVLERIAAGEHPDCADHVHGTVGHTVVDP